MDIKALRFFLHVADTLSFSRAAERLNVSQSVVTRVIAQLEHSVGIKLLDRTTRRVALTPGGVLLLKEAQPLMAHIESVQRAVRHAVAERSGRFTVGSTSMAMQTVTPAFLRRFKQIHPDVQLEVRELTSDAQVESLLSTEIDLGFLLMPASNPTLTVQPIYHERMRLAVPDDHPHATAVERNGAVPLSAFAADCFIIPAKRDNPTVHDEVIKACEDAGFRPRLRECAENQTCLGLARAGLGVLFIPSRRTNLPVEGLVFLEVADPVPELHIAAAWRTDDPSAFLAAFHANGWAELNLGEH
ncbi:TPA: LysR family transcriptional regulator [Stenotrophomonas maltophilia]|uniref:LysR family transcriptional regulator n=1 Tax=Stenotrophomonas TaxID=40323 RepID=UPI0015E62DBD|nr:MULTISPECIES: LysR family transcriptional regulator [unclassified Stenotrophomonas]MBH1461364.1 LysR family transcriptional regulator [Stenotrophomonas maltophilia]MDH0187992.1 LysR family transcriptional regulator [Stenotrophomonas sp. GD04051]MDH0464930.1 LysR family transcriptional regulator [Stenotrophomonas sp. GD03993]MDH0874990.1 LysR family transcriptional regulator [Stenotrophomonas sp. GD03877]MDH2155835.1 LysR family transcriptional regulator [Stenotrophomonas sp. GD03657]